MSYCASVASGALVLLVACSGNGSKEPEPRTPPPIKRAAQQQEQEIDPTSLVKLRLVADTTAVASGASFDLAAVFEMKPGWHIYWINPGESGLPTTAKFAGPDGFSIGEARFPGPIEFRSPGDVVSYGYEHETAVFARVTAPSGAAEAVTFRVEADWLACAEVCVTGDADAELTLQPGEPAPANEQLLAQYRERMPRPLTDIGLSARAGPTLLIPKTDVAYYPLDDQAAKLERVGQATRLTLPSGAQGVLRVEDAYYAVP